MSWLDKEQAAARITRLSEIPEDERPNFHEVLYGVGHNGIDRALESLTKNMKQRGQHVRR